MNRSKQKIKYLILLTAAVITLMVITSFLGLTLYQNRMIKESVSLSAERLFESIVLTRRWNASFGGVFVRKTEGVVSNPYLMHPDIVSASGLTYTMKNPALMTREISELANQSGLYKYHITSLNLKNPHNTPDQWEEEALKAFEDGETKREIITGSENGEKVYRLMRPLVVEDGCMSCHADQGYVIGDIRGGISVTLPFEKVAGALTLNNIVMAVLGLIIVLAFSAMFYFVIWRLIIRLFTVSDQLELQKKNLEELNLSLDKKVEERTNELLESEKRFRSTFEQAPMGICHVSNALHFIRMNKRFSRILGYSEQELKQKTFQDVFCSDEMSECTSRLNQLLTGDEILLINEKCYYRRDQSQIWINITISLVWQEDGEPDYYIVIVEDISERKKLLLQLQQAQKLEALGTLAGGIAHDFNNILSPILGYTEMNLMALKKGEQSEEYLQEVLLAACRAKELTAQILAFSRQENYERGPLEIISIIKEVVKLLRSSIPSCIMISMQLNINKCQIKANPIEIHQVLMNLCTNASQAMGNSPGKLEINVDKVEIDDEERGVSLAPGPYVMIEVSDTGPGIEPEALERIYEPYFTTKKKGEGTGLGLAVVHGIIENLKGIIHVYSEPDLGTTFRVLLPVLQKGLLVNEESVLDEIQGGNESILLVDDEPVITAMQKRMLVELGYEVTTMNDSHAALALFTANPENFDLVVSDVTMPKMTGSMLVTEMQSIRPDLPVILCTGYNASLTAKSVDESTIFAILTKPVFRMKFCQTVRQALDR